MSESEPNPQAVPEPSPASSAADGSVSAASAPSTDTSASKAESTPAEGATKSAEAATSAAPAPDAPPAPAAAGGQGGAVCSGPVCPSPAGTCGSSWGPAGSRRAGWHVSPGGCFRAWRACNGSGCDGCATGYDPAAGYGSAGRPPAGKPAHCCA